MPHHVQPGCITLCLRPSRHGLCYQTQNIGVTTNKTWDEKPRPIMSRLILLQAMNLRCGNDAVFSSSQMCTRVRTEVSGSCLPANPVYRALHTPVATCVSSPRGWRSPVRGSRKQQPHITQWHASGGRVSTLRSDIRISEKKNWLQPRCSVMSQNLTSHLQNTKKSLQHAGPRQTKGVPVRAALRAQKDAAPASGPVGPLTRPR